jgi:tetratricopeptide (TPR) repeat protein
MVDIFITYRKADARFGAAACYELLSRAFGGDRIFRDSVSMLGGEIYPKAIREALEQVKVLVALIGPDWFASGKDGRRLVDRDEDWVRREIRRALERGIEVIPVLLDGVPAPTAPMLPKDIEGLAYRQAVRIEHQDLGDGVRRLVNHIVARAPELVLADMFEPAPVLPKDPMPSMLLRAEYRIVPFERRSGELARLTAWLDRPDTASAWLLTGPGGQGKSRLAGQVVEAARAAGWAAGFLSEQVPATTLARIPEFQAPLLLVVDYAEGRDEQLVEVIQAMLARDMSTRRVRLLMLARSAGMWRHLLSRHRDDRIASLFATATEERLAALVPARADRRAEFARAARAFATAQGWDATRLPMPPALDADRYDRALDVHAAALAALLDWTGGPSDPRPAWRDPVLRVLDHERRYWAGTTETYQLPDPHEARLDQVVAAATLFGANTVPAARAVLDALPTFDRASGDQVARYLRWLGEIYPGPAVVNPLRPDRLGEDLVAVTLIEQPDLVTNAASGASDGQIIQALTVLTRAAPRHDGMLDAMVALMTPDRARRLPMGMMVATQIEDAGSLIAALDRLGGGSMADTDLEDVIIDRLPDASLVLAAFATVSTRAALEREERTAEPDPARLAQLHQNLAIRLGNVGQVDEALTTAARAVHLYRDLAAEDPDFRPDLASALDTLATAYGELGLPEDGLVPIAEAVEALRRLMPDDPALTHVLATSLMNQGNLLGDVGRYSDAVESIEQAVALQHVDADGAAADDLVDRRYRLALGLENLGVAFTAVGRRADALRVIVEAVEIIRDLDAQRQDSYRPSLIQALGNNLAAAHIELGQWSEAAEVAMEAVRLARDLVTRYGEVHLVRLADALNNAGSAARRLHQYDDALHMIQEAVTIYRRLAADRPGTQLSGLAGALHNLGNCLSEMDRPASARDAYDESIDIYRKLADPRPDIHEPDLAEALAGLAGLLHDGGESAEAAVLAEEAVEIYDRLAAGGQSALRLRFGAALHLLALVCADLDRHGEALAVSVRAAAVFADLVAEGEPDLRGSWASALHGLARSAQILGRHEQALAAFADALDILRPLSAEDSQYLDDLAGVLLNLAVCLTEISHADEALPLVEEAVNIRRRLRDSDPTSQLELAEALNNLADTLTDLGRAGEAVGHARKAVAIVARPYAKGHPDAPALYVYALLTLARALGQERPADAATVHARAWRVASNSRDEALIALVRASDDGPLT